jgi:hypothetical protein
MTPIKIILYSLSVAFVFKAMLIPFLKDLYLRQLEKHYHRLKRKVVDEDGWVNKVGAINQEWNDRRKNIRSSTHKPFDCIKCMSFWCSLIISICAGLQGESAFVGIAGLAAGMLLEGIMMRYL